MGQLIEAVQEKIKLSTTGVLLFLFRLVTGLFVGLTLALVGSEMIHYGDFSFSLVIVATTAVFLRVSRRWRFMGILIFNLICFLLGALLRMYIMLAPGA